MNRFLVYIIFFSFLGSISLHSQQKYYTKSGYVTFDSRIDSFVPVKATNNSVSSVFDPSKGEIAVLGFIKDFNFKNSLMQEHFNESYAESDIYPKTTFSGNLSNYKSNISGVYMISGIFNFHGVKKQLDKIPFVVEFFEDYIKITGEFVLNVSDFNIKVPKIVKSKIPSKMYVYVDMNLISN